MLDMQVISQLCQEADTKIVMLVVDGLGGLPNPRTGLTELETARTPNLDSLAPLSSCGLADPVGLGITPGSGPSHLALFGYDPLRYEIGRGVLEALGIGFDLGEDDIAARANFATMDEEGRITDRRAGRIETEKTRALCERLSTIKVEGAEVIIRPGKVHRFVLILRGEGLSDEIEDTDPQATGVPARKAAPRSGLGSGSGRGSVSGSGSRSPSKAAARTAAVVNTFVEKGNALLADARPANTFLLRGFARRPDIPTMREMFRLRPAAIATYPMYRGVAKLIGMDVLDAGASLADELECLARAWTSYDFFYVHVKETDSYGEDGNFDRRVEIIEEVDRAIARLVALGPDVLVVTGDHSTPAMLKAHSWHPVPVLIYSKWCRRSPVARFTETEAIRGSLGRIPALGVMPLALANALRMTKFGA